VGSDDARAEAAARLLSAAGVKVVAGVPRAALAPPARPGEALAAFRSLGAQARAAKSTSVEDGENDPFANVPEISREQIMEFLRCDDDDLDGPPRSFPGPIPT
jgi:hypothetical protein